MTTSRITILLSMFAVVAVNQQSFAQDSAKKPVQANDLVEIFEKLGGKHPGFRKAHARGLCASGIFTPSTDQAMQEHFKNASLLSNGELPVSMRFSLGGANPNADERAPGTRGAGMKITLPDGSMHVFTGNNFPVFAGKDPETFFGFLSTLLPDEDGVRDPKRTGKFIMENPSVQAHAAWQQSAKTAASYANTEFFGLHTFFYNQGQPAETKFRWHLTPDLGVQTLSKDEAAQKPEAFLADTMKKQMADSTVSFTLHASIGQAEDSDIDPSSQWPSQRAKVSLGKITLTSAGDDSCNNTNYDPNLLSNGFSPSADAVLRMRSPAYAISFGKRLSNQ